MPEYPGIELFVRGMAAGAFLALGLMAARTGPLATRVTGAALSVAAAAHAVSQYFGSPALTHPALAPVWALSAMAAGIFWAFVRALFDDRGRAEPVALVLAIGLLVLAMLAVNAPRPQPAISLWALHNLLSAGAVLHAAWRIGRGLRDDLVERRRNLRTPFLGAAAIYALIVIGVQLTELSTGPVRGLAPLGAAALLVLAAAAVAVFSQLDPAVFGGAGEPARAGSATPAAGTDHPAMAAVAEAGAPGPVATATTVPLDAAAPALPRSAADMALIRQLDTLMRTERPYREEGLTVGALALRLGVTEHRLRAVINGVLGHRNFSAYLNGWRLEEVKAALGNAAEAEVPISTIALDAGFQSLGPFNRAFKLATGETPSAYRSRALANAGIMPEPPMV